MHLEAKEGASKAFAAVCRGWQWRGLRGTLCGRFWPVSEPFRDVVDADGRTAANFLHWKGKTAPVPKARNGPNCLAKQGRDVLRVKHRFLPELLAQVGED